MCDNGSDSDGGFSLLFPCLIYAQVRSPAQPIRWLSLTELWLVLHVESAKKPATNEEVFKLLFTPHRPKSTTLSDDPEMSLPLTQPVRSFYTVSTYVTS